MTPAVYLTRREAAALAKVHPTTIARWAREGLIGEIRVGRVIRYRESDVRDVLDGSLQRRVVVPMPAPTPEPEPDAEAIAKFWAGTVAAR